MSYVFNGVNGLLDDQQKDPNAATNIFAPEESGANPAQGAQQQGNGEQPKTSTEGEIGGNGPTSGAQGSEAKPAEQPQAADSRLMKKNKVKEAPKFATQAQGDLATAQKNLQSEADSYVKGATDKGATYAVDDAGLEKAIGGDQDAQGKVRRVLSGTADKYDSFAPKTDYTIEDINAMQSDAGLDQLLRRDAGAEYSAGEAAFDRSLLNRSGEFNQLRSLLRGQQEGLTKQADEWSGAEGVKSKEAQAAVDSGYMAARDAATKGLGSRSDALRAAQDEEVRKENEARKALRASKDKTYATGQGKAVLDKLIADTKAAGDPSGLLKYLNAGLIDPATFVKIAGDVSFDQAIDDKEASRFNSIMSLLGKEDHWDAGAGFGDRQSFDKKGYSDSVYGKAKETNAKADAAAQAEINRIMAELERQRSDEIAYREKMKANKGMMGGSDAATVEKIREAIRAEYGGGEQWQKNYLGNLESLVNAGDFLNYNDINTDATDWLDDSQAAALNKAYAELGGPYNQVKAGSRGGQRSAFDAAGYEAALRSILNGGGRDGYKGVLDKLGDAGKMGYEATNQTDEIDPLGRGIKKVVTSTKWKR